MKRVNGQGSIYFDKARKKFVAELVDPDGNRIKARFNTEEEADGWLTGKRAEIFKGIYAPPSDETVGGWSVEYLQTYAAPAVKPRTLMIYQDAAAKLAPIAKIPLRKLTAVNIQRFYNNIEGSDDLKHKVHKYLRLLLNKAVALEMIPKNPLIAVTPPKQPNPDIDTFSVEEIKQLLTFVETARYYKKYYPLIYTAVHTGARIGELLALKTWDINKNSISINATLVEAPNVMEGDPKTFKSKRKVTISSENVKLLKDNNKIMSYEGYIFHTNTGGPIAPSNMERAWRKILEKAGLPKKHFHALRHTHATELLGAGVPVLEVSKRLGHAKPSTTLNRYGHAIKGYDETLPDKILKIFG